MFSVLVKDMIGCVFVPLSTRGRFDENGDAALFHSLCPKACNKQYTVYIIDLRACVPIPNYDSQLASSPPTSSVMHSSPSHQRSCLICESTSSFVASRPSPEAEVVPGLAVHFYPLLAILEPVVFGMTLLSLISLHKPYCELESYRERNTLNWNTNRSKRSTNRSRSRISFLFASASSTDRDYVTGKPSFSPSCCDHRSVLFAAFPRVFPLLWNRYSPCSSFIEYAIPPSE